MSSSSCTRTITTTTEQHQRQRQRHHQQSPSTLKLTQRPSTTPQTSSTIMEQRRQPSSQEETRTVVNVKNRPQSQPQPPKQQQEHFQTQQHPTSIKQSQSPCNGSCTGRRRPIRTMLGNWMDRQRSLRQQRTIEREILTIQSKIQEQQETSASTSSSSNSTHSGLTGESLSDNTFQIQLEQISSSEGGDVISATPYKQLLTQEEMQQLHTHLPDVLRNSCKANTWKCLYSLYRDGDSFDTFLSNVSSYKQTLLVIQTSTNELLGGFVEEEWKHTSGGGIVGSSTTISSSAMTTDTTGSAALGGKEFYGSGRAFLFSISKNNEQDTTTSHSDRGETKEATSSTVHVYPWTGKNRYIQYCCQLTKTIAMGGGGGSFGFVIQNNFTTGSTGKCDTFDNSPLVTGSGGTSSNMNDPISSSAVVDELQLFDIIDVEVYTFVGSI